MSEIDEAENRGYLTGLDNIIASLDTLIESATLAYRADRTDFNLGRIAGLSHAKGQAVGMQANGKNWS